MKPRALLRRNLLGGIAIAWHASRLDFAATLALSAIGAAIPPIEIWLAKHLVDLVTLGHHDAAALLPTVVVLGVLFGGQRALGLQRWHHQELFGHRVERHVMREFLAKSAAVDIGHFDDPTWHDSAARARRDVTWLPLQLTIVTFELISSVLSILAMVGLLLSIHPALAGLVLVSVLPWITLQSRINRQIFEFHANSTPADRERHYVADLMTSPEHAKELRSFGLGRHFLGLYTRATDERARQYRRLVRRSALLALVAGLCTAVVVAVAYQFVAARGLGGTLTAGDLAAAFGAFASVISQAGGIAQQVGQLERHAQFLDDYFAFLATPPLVAVAAQPTLLPEPLPAGIALANVRFTYPRGTAEALAGVDLEVRPGELVALVGENGAGKTTIVNLLSRFYDPDGGRISIGGVDLHDVDPIALRSRIGVLLQDFRRYQLSLRDNVQLGRIDRAASDAEVLDALEAARATSLVASLAKGLDARLGQQFDGGHDLSGGQWQRLAVARLMFRRADIWILDEPTSNLDPQAEAEIFAELKQQLAGRMAIVISHRFSTVRVADRIYVLEHGRVLESGSHDELVAARGRYAELFELQAAGYR